MDCKEVLVVIPNWNGKKLMDAPLKALADQSCKPDVLVVDNGSSDGSAAYIKKNYKGVSLLELDKNQGFAGGVNRGIEYAIENNYDFVALLNNDAKPDKDWVKSLRNGFESKPEVGIATSKMLAEDGTIDSTGECLSKWGLAFPRGRGETDRGQYDKDESALIFGASGGATMYKTELFNAIGLFDEDFFAYYEDIDLSFRAQLMGWKVAYARNAVVHHKIGSTSSRLAGFRTYHSLKNQSLMLLKNTPRRILFGVSWRFLIAKTGFFIQACRRGELWPALKGELHAIWLAPKKFLERIQIQRKRIVSSKYIQSMLYDDLPPRAKALRKFRSIFWTQ